MLGRVFAWQVDMHRMFAGDRFSVVYDEEYRGGITTRLDVIAARILHDGRDHQVFGFRADDLPMDHFDAHGRGVRRQFLPAPIVFTRISSAFSTARHHPIDHQLKPHLGTDLAAPEGTPIVATADGVVSEASFTGGNGHYIKITHDATYTTAYLHMSRTAATVGERVLQGRVIGYVGSTGAATGPHVCYRVWRGGEPVDAQRLAPPSAASIHPSVQQAFAAHRDSMRLRLRMR